MDKHPGLAHANERAARVVADAYRAGARESNNRVAVLESQLEREHRVSANLQARIIPEGADDNALIAHIQRAEARIIELEATVRALTYEGR